MRRRCRNRGEAGKRSHSCDEADGTSEPVGETATLPEGDARAMEARRGRNARRRRESNPLIAVLQTAAFPLGYSAIRMRAMGISEDWSAVNRTRKMAR